MKKNPLDIIIYLIVIILVSLFIFVIINYINSKASLSSTYLSKENDLFDNNFISGIIEENKTDTNFLIEPKIISQEEPEIINPDITITLSAIGDIMCHNTQFKDAYSNNTYDFSYVFSDISNFISEADIAIGNLETTFAGADKKYSGYPNFNTPEALATDLAELGLDVITTANNHCLDTGISGLESTLNHLDNAGLSHIGTSRSTEEQNSILIKDVNGIKIAFLAYTYGTNGIQIPEDKNYSVNLIEKDFILSQIEKAKLENPDLICVNMHWGNEYELSPNDTQLDLTNFLFENGVDIILGSHPHVLQPLEIRTVNLPDGTTKDCFVIYSLGNFMSGQTQKNTQSSIILNIKLTKKGSDGKITFEEILYTPIYTYTKSAYKNYKVMNLQKEIENYEAGNESLVSGSNYSIFRAELDRINSIYIP